MKNLVLLTLLFLLFGFVSPVHSEMDRSEDGFYCLNEYYYYPNHYNKRKLIDNICLTIDPDYIMLISNTDTGMEFKLTDGTILYCDYKNLVPVEVCEEALIEALKEKGIPSDYYDQYKKHLK